MKYVFIAIIIILYLYGAILQYNRLYEGDVEILQIPLIRMRPEIIIERKPVVVTEVGNGIMDTKKRLRLMYIMSRNDIVMGGGGVARISRCKYTLMEGNCKLAIHSPLQMNLLRPCRFGSRMRVRDYGLCESVSAEVPSICIILREGMTLILPVHWGYSCIEGECRVEYLHDTSSIIMTSFGGYFLDGP